MHVKGAQSSPSSASPSDTSRCIPSSKLLGPFSDTAAPLHTLTMDDSSPTPIGMSEVRYANSPSPSSHLRHRHSTPDVPQDVEDDLWAHFNDPNYDYDASSTAGSTARESFELGKKASARWSDLSITVSSSELESQYDSSRATESKGNLGSEASYDE